jgi:nucleoid-associated protein YgaU
MKLDASLRTFQLKQEEIDRLQNALANIDNERAQLADRLNEANTRANQSASQATAGQEASAQLTGIREQLRQAQNQIASLATENQQLKNRLALSGPPPSSLMGVPTRPGSAAAQAITSTRPAEPAAAPAVRTHTVVDGDTLTRIARRYYGSSDRWAEILEANRGAIKDPNNLTLGTKLRIP